MRWLYILMFAATVSAETPAAKVASVLDDWHQAAAAANFARYFGHFAPNGVFLGTDASERWTVSEFQAYAKPRFEAKKTWNFHPHDRHIDFSSDGSVAWFDEALDTPNLGPCRGSGVLVRQKGVWKIAQYNLSMTIPNPLAPEVVKMEAAGKK
jgi:SnoaL-like domain